MLSRFSHYPLVMNEQRKKKLERIEEELKERVASLQANNQLLEAHS